MILYEVKWNKLNSRIIQQLYSHRKTTVPNPGSITACSGNTSQFSWEYSFLGASMFESTWETGIKATVSGFVIHGGKAFICPYCLRLGFQGSKYLISNICCSWRIAGDSVDKTLRLRFKTCSHAVRQLYSFKTDREEVRKSILKWYAYTPVHIDSNLLHCRVLGLGYDF